MQQFSSVTRYVMDRYANMRSTDFVKCISRSQGTSAADTQVVFIAIRTKVIIVVASSEAKAEQELWVSVGESEVANSIKFEKKEVDK